MPVPLLAGCGCRRLRRAGAGYGTDSRDGARAHVDRLADEMSSQSSNRDLDRSRNLFARRCLRGVNAKDKATLRRRGLIDSEFVRAPVPALDARDRSELAVMLDEVRDLLIEPLPAPVPETTA